MKKIKKYNVVIQVFCLMLVLAIINIALLLFTKTILGFISKNIFHTYSLLISQICIDASFLIIIFITIKMWKLELMRAIKIPSFKVCFYILLFAFCAFSYDILLGTYFYSHLFEGKLPVISITTPRLRDGNDIYLFIKIFFLAPIYEELFYRRIIFTRFKERYGLIKAMIFSSLFFAFGHFDFSVNLLSFFLAGLIFSYIYYKTNSILTVILLHAFCNVFNKFQKFIDVDLISKNYWYLLLYFLGFVGVYYSFKKLVSPLIKEKGYFYFKHTKI